MKWYLGVDIGGTSFKAMAYSQDSNQSQYSELIQRETGSEDPQEVLKEIQSVYLSFKQNFGCDAQALAGGFPGILDSQSLVVGSPNLPAWQGIQLHEWSRQTLQVPSTWTNDANCAAYGELVQPGREGVMDLLMLTLGTGVGAGIVTHGQMVIGRGFAGEAGHVQVEEGGAQCGCGRRGCLETVFSKLGFERAILEHFGPESTMDLIELFEVAQDPQDSRFDQVQKIMDYAFDRFALGISNMVTLLDPEVIVLAGGLTNSREYILETLPRYLAQRIKYPGYTLPRIEISELGSLAGVKGAIGLARQIKI